MGKDKEAIRTHGVERHRSDVGSADTSARHGLFEAGLRQALRRNLDVVRQFGWPIAVGLRDAGRHEGWAQQAHAQPRLRQPKVVKERLGKRDHGVLRHVVDPHERRREPAGHGGRVDDMAGFPVGLGREHARNEVADAVHHAHQVDPHYPLPVALGVFPQVATAADPGVVHQQVYAAQLRERAVRELRHLAAVRNVDDLIENGDAAFAQLVDDRIERVGLHIGEYQAHAVAGRQARELTPETAARAGDDGDFVVKGFHSFENNPATGTASRPDPHGRRPQTATHARRHNAAGPEFTGEGT